VEGRRIACAPLNGCYFRSGDRGLWANEAGSATLCVVGPAEHFYGEKCEHRRAGLLQADRWRREFGNHRRLEAAHALHDPGAEVERNFATKQISKRWKCVGV